MSARCPRCGSRVHRDCRTNNVQWCAVAILALLFGLLPAVWVAFK